MNAPAATRQLVLDVGLHDGAVFDGFVAGDNAALVETLKQQAAGGGEAQVYLYGAPGAGKSHLLQAACHAANQAGLTASYLPLRDMPGVGAGVLEGLEQVALVCIDDLQAVAGDDAWERGLFNLVNASRAAGNSLVFAAAEGPAGLGVRLPDLASRLSWGAVFRLQPLSDADRLAVLRRRAERRGFELPDEVGRYLLNNCPRDLGSLIGLLDHIDRATLAEQRRVTIPFIRQLLAS
ncbi:MAG TPA: DnaA regulatory inactivator Hda [Thioalkalivibrio sp.]|nr:DnaA regulatory inactivator Hda [Thioalkalivibrio sp.]